MRKPFTVFSITLAKQLIQNGFKVVNIDFNRKSETQKIVFYFEDSQLLRDYVDFYIKLKKDNK